MVGSFYYRIIVGTPTMRRQRFVRGQVAWMLGTIVLLAVLGALSLELFVIGSLLGLLVLTELTAPINVTPRWRTRIRYIIAIGMLVFGYFMARRVVEVLPDGVL